MIPSLCQHLRSCALVPSPHGFGAVQVHQKSRHFVRQISRSFIERLQFLSNRGAHGAVRCYFCVRQRFVAWSKAATPDVNGHAMVPSRQRRAAWPNYAETRVLAVSSPSVLLQRRNVPISLSRRFQRRNVREKCHWRVWSAWESTVVRPSPRPIETTNEALVFII